VIGKSILILLPPDRKIEMSQIIDKIKRGEYLRHFETKCVTKLAQIVDVSLGISPIKTASGQIVGVSVIARDITERKKAEAALQEAHLQLEQRVIERTAELQDANKALEKAARLKDEFLASMSHELRTPLTGILGLSESMLMKIYGDLNEKQEFSLENIHKSGKHLLELINDILDLSKIEAEKLELNLNQFSLGDICQGCIQITRGLAQEKSLSVSFSMDPASIVMVADARRLKQMLVNLLSNAIKFTPEGGSIGLQVHGRREERQVLLTVSDTGIGIKSEDFPRLFQAFTQLDARLARQYTGTGLGLSLVKRLAEMHGGSVSVESEFGKGSRFTIKLPWLPDNPLQADSAAGASPASTTRSAPLVSQSPQSQVILLVDDNEIICEVLTDFLISKGYQAIALSSGADLLDKVADILPTLILMDIQMPGMNGIEAIKYIRARSDPRIAGLPIIAITALAMIGDRERCLAAGANDYMSKPLQLESLVETIQKLCN
jgi:signal transduction histidine kinase/CheY-like chemotaxis protein